MFPCDLVWKILIGKAFLITVLIQVVNKNQNSTPKTISTHCERRPPPHHKKQSLSNYMGGVVLNIF